MSVWQSMANAPKDRKVDLWAKHWNAERDRFEFDRFPNCRWWKADSMGSWKEHWHDLPNGWFPTHWMDAPSGPIDTQSAASGGFDIDEAVENEHLPDTNGLW